MCAPTGNLSQMNSVISSHNRTESLQHRYLAPNIFYQSDVANSTDNENRAYLSACKVPIQDRYSNY